MLTVDVEKRISIDECLEHPWILNRDWINPADSTDGLTGALGQLDFSKRKVQRERTLLSSINDVKVSKIVEVGGTQVPGPPGLVPQPVHVKVWEKNPTGKQVKMSQAKGKKEENKKVQAMPADTKGKKPQQKKEEDPSANRAADEFMEMGGKGDMQLFGDDVSSRYLPQEVPRVNGADHK